MRYIAVFVLGVVLGACLTNVLLARHIEQLHLNQSELEHRLKAADDEIVYLKESLAEQSYYAVVSINPLITIKDNKLSAVETRAVAQTIRQDVLGFLAPLKGQEVRALNPVLILGMVDDRVVKIDRNEFVLKVALLLISEDVVVHVEAQQRSSRNVPIA